MADIRVPVLRGTIEILKSRGWNEQYTADPGAGLNIRSALLQASQRTGKPWYQGYTAVAQFLTKELGGIQYWEYGTTSKGKRRPRVHKEVVEILETLLSKLESHEKDAGGSPGSGGPSGSAV